MNEARVQPLRDDGVFSQRGTDGSDVGVLEDDDSSRRATASEPAAASLAASTSKPTTGPAAASLTVSTSQPAATAPSATAALWERILRPERGVRRRFRTAAAVCRLPR